MSDLQKPRVWHIKAKRYLELEMINYKIDTIYFHDRDWDCQRYASSADVIIEPGFACEDGTKFFAGDVVEIGVSVGIVKHGAYCINGVSGHGFYLERKYDGFNYQIHRRPKWQKLGTIHDSKSKESEASDD